MHHKHVFLFCAVGLALALSACTSSRDGMLRLYQRNSGDIINLDVGETMEVMLDGDPGTEIHWVQAPGDSDILRQIGSTEYKPDLESHTAERKLVTQFQATAPGRMRLKLTYRNPGEGRPATSIRITTDQAFDVWVVVKEQG